MAGFLDTLKELADKQATKSAKSKPIKETALPQAHSLERHLVHPKLSWEEGVAKLREVFPKDARPERPAKWYRRLSGNHWPGQVPPGNGPFYVPQWAFDGPDWARVSKALSKEGFKEVVAHVVHIPADGEYLHATMRAAGIHAPDGGHPWNLDATTSGLGYLAFLYPNIPGFNRKKMPLRPFTIERAVL